MFTLTILLLFISVHFSVQIDNSPIFCTKTFCKEYKLLNSCPEFPEGCKIQNATHNGITMPYYGPCNCCQYCIETLGKGDKCITGNVPGSQIPKTVCGDGLSCRDSGICDDIDTECTRQQKKFDKRKEEGNVGHMELRPECDRNGEFKPLKCIPGETCFCVSRFGQRIFGEMTFESDIDELLMNCACSRNVDLANNLVSEKYYSLLRPHCLPDGRYDEIQCLNQTCMCVDSHDGFPDPDTKVAVPMINKDNLPCFNEKYHEEKQYLRECEAKYLDVMEEVKMYKEQGMEMLGVKYPKCQFDGRYAPVQEQDDYVYCAYPNSTMLNKPDGTPYKVPKSGQLAKTMNCKCARAASIMSGKEKPTCCDNGNYVSIQCRRGLCRCVDSDGLQTVKEVQEKDKAKLDCVKDKCTS